MFPSSAVGEGDMLAKPVDNLTSFASSCVLSECQRRRTLHELSDQGQAAWEQILQQLEINHLSNWVHFTLSGFPGTSHRFAVLLHAS